MERAIFLFLIFFVGLEFFCLAEEACFHSNSYKSKNGRFDFRFVDKKSEKRFYDSGDEYDFTLEETWGLFDLTTNKQLYSIKGIFSYNTAFVSDNGKYITLLYDCLNEDPHDTTTVLKFYNYGKLKSRYKLGSLLCNVRNSYYVESQYHWIVDTDLSSKKGIFSLNTFEFRTLIFNIESGELTKVERHPDFNKNSILAYGGVKKLKNNYFEMDVERVIYGAIPEDKKIKFKSKYSSHNSWQLVLINDSKFRKYWPGLRLWEISPRLKMNSSNEGCFN